MLMSVYIFLKIYAKQYFNYTNSLTSSEEIQYSSHVKIFFQTHVYLFLTFTSASIKHKEN